MPLHKILSLFEMAKACKPKKKKEQVIPELAEDKKKELAELVQQYPALWDVTHEGHKRLDEQTKCWDRISEIMGLTGENQ